MGTWLGKKGIHRLYKALRQQSLSHKQEKQVTDVLHQAYHSNLPGWQYSLGSCCKRILPCQIEREATLTAPMLSDRLPGKDFPNGHQDAKLIRIQKWNQLHNMPLSCMHSPLATLMLTSWLGYTVEKPVILSATLCFKEPTSRQALVTGYIL